MSRFALGIVTLLAVVVAGGLLTEGLRSPSVTLPYEESLADWIGPTDSLEELIAASDVVVVGEVTGIDGTYVVFPDGYDPDDGHLPDGVSPGVTFTKLRVSVHEYLKGEGPATLTMTQTGDLTTTRGTREFPKPEFGRAMVLFLTAEHGRGPNVWASHRGPFGRILVTNGGPVFAWDNGTREVPWLDGGSMDGIAQQILDTVARMP